MSSKGGNYPVWAK